MHLFVKNLEVTKCVLKIKLVNLLTSISKQMAKKTIKLAIPDEIITSKIYLIRDRKVMLDEDLAELYGVTTGNLNKAVNRNLTRFPDDFMFRVTKEEFDNLIFQFGTSSWGGRRKLPNAFTEQGVAMLSGVLHSERAITVNIQIMRVFTKVREIMTDNLSVRLEIEEIKKQLVNHDKNIELVFSYLDELIEKHDNQKPRKAIGFKPSHNDNQ